MNGGVRSSEPGMSYRSVTDAGGYKLVGYWKITAHSTAGIIGLLLMAGRSKSF
ncbi:MAG: hypothetical protein MI748_00720 [Opitutales bacterium]|nr:hypothetical protein [Opitutales bacterium]